MDEPAKTDVIPKSYLTGLIVKCGLFFTSGLILTGIMLYFSAHQPLGPSYLESFTRLSQLKQEMFFKSIAIYSTLMILVTTGVVFITITYSHRVVGPLVGLKRIIAAMSKGDLTKPAILRSNDAIKPVADSLNDCMGTYRTILANIAIKTEEMRNIQNDTGLEDKLIAHKEKAKEISYLKSS